MSLFFADGNSDDDEDEVTFTTPNTSFNRSFNLSFVTNTEDGEVIFEVFIYQARDSIQIHKIDLMIILADLLENLNPILNCWKLKYCRL